MSTITFNVDDRFSAELLDHLLHCAYSPQLPVEFRFNLTQAHITNVKHILRAKPILEKYRPLTKKYLKNTTVIVGNRLTATLVRSALVVLRPEKPVKVYVSHT